MSKNPKDKTGFLVMANATNKDGRYKEGTPGQEESICRRTDLTKCFKKMSYPIPDFGVFYVEGINIIRDTEKNGYKYLDQPIKTNCVLSAAYHGPPTNNKNELCDGFREKTKRKMASILNSFLKNNVLVLVLGAYGCGAFQNPVEDIAKLFHELLNNEFKNKFKHIVFAVMKDACNKNYKVFKDIFS